MVGSGFGTVICQAKSDAAVLPKDVQGPFMVGAASRLYQPCKPYHENVAVAPGCGVDRMVDWAGTPPPELISILYIFAREEVANMPPRARMRKVVFMLLFSLLLHAPCHNLINSKYDHPNEALLKPEATCVQRITS